MKDKYAMAPSRKLTSPWRRKLHEVRRDGLKVVWERFRIRSKILRTPPILTDTTGPVDVRVLTWRLDWINLIWALKSFYHFSNVRYPLVIHDGGLTTRQSQELRRHFPNARLVPLCESNVAIPARLEKLGLRRSAEFRRVNGFARKLFDFIFDSDADYFVAIDSDLLFFRSPDLLLLPTEGLEVNRYNRDEGYWYSASLEQLGAVYGITPAPEVNAGLAIIRRASFNLNLIERFLSEDCIFGDPLLTEQTIHALCSSKYGMEFLPSTYRIGGPPGITEDIVCKHYSGVHRPLLYSEGMTHLIRSGFLDALHSGHR